MRTILIALFVCSALLACDTQNSAKLNRSATSPIVDLPVDDRVAVTPSADTVLQFSTTTLSTSADGSVADLKLTYTLDPAIRFALKPGALVQFEYFAENQTPWVIARSVITDALGGSVKASVPTSDQSAKIVATVTGLLPDIIDDSQGTLAAHTWAIPKRETTDLDRVGAVQVELVDGSYESELTNGRRVHRFAIKVIDPSAGPIVDLLTDIQKQQTEDQRYSISGLEKNPTTHFAAVEDGFHDGESPVTVSFTEHPLEVYMVLDISKSVVDSGLADQLSNAASNSVIKLRQGAEFDYRAFNGQVNRLDSLRDLDFDTGASSATALYYAIDTALSDIENFGSITQDKVLMVFTDGVDLASRNHYNGDFLDHDQVHQYIVQRVKQVRKEQQYTLGRQLDVYTIGFYNQDGGFDMADEVRKLNMIAEAGGTKESFNNLIGTGATNDGVKVDNIEDAFNTVVHNISGVYYLQYSSQQTPENNELCIQVYVNGIPGWVQLPNGHDKVDCSRHPLVLAE